MMRAVWIALALVSVGLAGCADGGGGQQEDDTFDDVKVTASANTGAIRGVVLDPAIQPVAGASVAVLNTDFTTTTNERGAFGFSDMDPGSYFLVVTKPGYSEVQRDVEVVAGLAEPDIVKVLIERIPGTEPTFNIEKWEGFLECSTRAGTGPAGLGSVGVNVCSVGDGVGNQDTEHPYEFERTPDYFQVELVWDSTQAFGGGLSLVLGPESCADVKYNRSDGASPRWLTLDREQLDAEGVGIDEGLCTRVFSWTADETANTFGLVLQQRFTVFSTRFFNFEPETDWLFVEDGEPVPPA